MIKNIKWLLEKQAEIKLVYRMYRMIKNIKWILEKQAEIKLVYRMYRMIKNIKWILEASRNNFFVNLLRFIFWTIISDVRPQLVQRVRGKRVPRVHGLGEMGCQESTV
jgi:hypothetical protein